MKRLITESLLAWKASKDRKPLILKGARQVGKTYILKEFGKQEYATVAYFNFEKQLELADLFKGNLEPLEILKVLAIEAGMVVKPKETLIIFDEIQACPQALTSLKYFQEEASEYHICAAGSLLGVTLAKSANFPVGKVDFLHLYPLSFEEFLAAKEEVALVEYLNELDRIEPLPLILHVKLLKIFKEFLYTGGMPAAVLAYHDTADFQKIRVGQQALLDAYQLDFAKHAPEKVLMKINQIWSVIPSQLSKENKKFIYSVIRTGARAQDFEQALQWLVEAGLIYKSYNITTPKLPLKAYINFNIFKIYALDVGLLSAMAGLSAKTLIHGDEIFQEFRGAITENYVAQELARQGLTLLYWTSPSSAELDFIVVFESQIYPLEVKAGTSQAKRSLSVYMQKYLPVRGIRVSALNLKEDGKILNCPLYLISKLAKLLVT